jgi:tetratricopeptide (TPR) repeat protein
VRKGCALLLVLFAVGACSSSALIRRDDATYARGLAHLERSTTLVETSGAPPGQRAMFLQAESLYRYRFELGPRGVGNYLVQSLAVASEFAPLQALAASAGMFELRLRVYDGAVQLWESLLERHPDTALRPLALYRLGWAYRSIGASGFPRDEGTEAFDELVARYPTSPLAPLALEAKGVPWKSQDTALAWSAVPGLGQFYAGERLNGAVRLTAALACAAMIVVPSVLLYRRVDDRDKLVFAQDWPYVVTPFVGIILLNVVYTTAYQDAIRAAVDFNERAEAAFESRHPEAP